MNQVTIRIVFDRKKIATKEKSALIQLECTFEKQRKFLSTNIKVCKHQFKNGRIVNHPNQTSLNQQIFEQINELEAIVNKYNELQIGFDLRAFEEKEINGYYCNITFVQFLAERIEERNIAESTKKQHHKVLNFLQNEYKSLMMFADLTPTNILRLDEYLHKRTIEIGGVKKKMMQTAIYEYHKILRHYINEAVFMGYIKENPYKKFKVERGQAREREILTMDEIQKIMEFNTSSTLLAKCRDLFIVQCYTGMAYSDLMNFDFSTKRKVDGKWVAKDTRQKTGVPFFITLLDPVCDVLKRYDGKLPHLAYDVYNRNLKAVASSCGIDKHISTHIGRHTFATTIALASGVAIEVVAKMLGHTDIKTTQIYAKIMPEQVLSGFDAISMHLSQKQNKGASLRPYP